MSKTPTTAYHLVSEMELPLLNVQNFARLIAWYAASLDADDDDTAALQAAAYHIVDLVEGLKERHEKALHLLNPNRDHAAPTVALVRPSGDK